MLLQVVNYQHCRNNDEGDDAGYIYPRRQGCGAGFCLPMEGKYPARRRRVTADRAAAAKKSFLTGKTAGRTAHGGEIPSAAGTTFRVRGNFGAAVLTEKTGAFGNRLVPCG